MLKKSISAILFILIFRCIHSIYCFEYTSPAIPYDINNDGRDEIIVFTSENKMIVYEYYAGGNQILYTSVTKGIVNRTPAIADINCDGRKDIIILTLNGYLQVFDALTGKVNPLFENIKINLYSSGSPVVADVDGDSEPEILLAGRQVYGYDGSGKLKTGFPYNLISEIEKPLGIMDYNNDGVMDIFAATQDKRCYIINAKSKSVTNLTELNFRMDARQNIIIDDVDNDSIPELCSLSLSAAPYKPFYYNSSSGIKFINDINILDKTPYIAGIGRIGINEYKIVYQEGELYNENNTTKVIFIATSPSNPVTKGFWERIDINSMVNKYESNYSYPYYNGLFLDYNGDGLQDIIFTSLNEGFNVFGYTELRPDTFHRIDSQPYSGSDLFAVSAGDINGDGLAEIISTDTGNIRIKSTPSKFVYSPYPFCDALNSNNQFNIAPPLIIPETYIITCGNKFLIKWKKPYFCDTYLYSYSLNNSTFTGYSADTQLLLSGLADGDYSFKIKSINQNGRKTLYAANLKFAIDNKPPVVYFISPQNNQSIEPGWNMRIYVKDDHLNTFSCSYKTNTGFINFYENSTNCESQTIRLPEFSGDTVTLKISAFEIENNNYSETEITVFISNTNSRISPNDNKTLYSASNDLTLNIFPNTVNRVQEITIKHSQLQIYKNELMSPVFYIGPENLECINPFEISIKYSDTYLNNASYSPDLIKKNNFLSSVFSVQPAIYYTSDSTVSSLEKLNSIQSGNYLTAFASKKGYYFIGADSAAVSVSGLNVSAEFEAVPRIISNFSDLRFVFRLNEVSPVTIKLFDLKGNRITTFTENEIFPAGQSRTKTYNLEHLKLSTGNYILYFKSNSAKCKKVIFVK